jgi:hypothetical protein
MRNRSDRTTPTIIENPSQPQQQYSRSKDNYNNESEEFVPPLQSRRSNGFQHQRNERYLFAFTMTLKVIFHLRVEIFFLLKKIFFI